MSSSVVKANRDFGKGFKQVLFDLVDLVDWWQEEPEWKMWNVGQGTEDGG